MAAPTREQGGSGPGTVLGEILVRLRRAAGLSQAELAGRARISERSIRELERGVTRRPRRTTIDAVADALGMDEAQRWMLVHAAAPTSRTSVGPSGHTRGGKPLIGRSDELARLYRVVVHGPSRLVTVTGPGGVGKSRLAAEVLAVVAARHRFPVRSVDFSGLADDFLVGEVLAEAVGAVGRSRLDAVTRIQSTLGSRRLLLLVDGFERMRAAAGILREMVARCPGVTALVTSRVALRVGEEHELPLGPLSVPAKPGTDDPQVVGAAPAVRLLLHHGAVARPGLVLDRSNAAAVAQICRVVGGVPLAVELAAARLRLLSPVELAARLTRPLAVLNDGPPDLPVRHRSLRAVIESSLDIVGPQARDLFVRLAPAAAGVSLDDLEQIVDRDLSWLLSGLGDLVEANLLHVTDTGHTTRYRLLDVTAELSAEMLGHRPDRDEIIGATARHFLGRLVTAGQRTDGRAFTDVDPDVHNVRAALTWARENTSALLDVPLVEAWYRYCESRGRFAEGRATLAAIGTVDAPGSAWALLKAGILSQYLGDLSQAHRLAGAGLARLPAADDVARGEARLVLGAVTAGLGDLDAAREHTVAALRHGEAARNDRLVGRAHNNLAAAAVEAGDVEGAEPHLRRALAAKRKAGASDVEVARTLMNLAETTLHVGRAVEARHHAEEAAELFGRGGHVRLKAFAHLQIALANLPGEERADPDAARAAMDRALALLPDFGEDEPMRGAVEARASVVLRAVGDNDAAVMVLVRGAEAMLRGHPAHELPYIVDAHAVLTVDSNPAVAVQLLGFARALRDRLGSRQPPNLRTIAAQQRARTLLGSAAFDHEWRHGVRMLGAEPARGLHAVVTGGAASAAVAAGRSASR